MSADARRHGGGRRGGGGPNGADLSLFSTLKGIFAGGSIFSGDYYAIDGGTSKVASIIDHLDPTHALTQGTSAQQVAAPSADANLNSALSFTFAVSQRYTSNRAASTWAYLHGASSTPSTTVAVFVPNTDGASVTNNTIFSSVRNNDFTTQVGALLAYSTTTTVGGLIYRVGNGAAQVISTTPTTVFSQNVGSSMRVKYAEGTATEFSVHKLGVLASSGNSTNAPSASAPQSSLVLGASAVTFDQGLAGRLAFLAMVPKELSANELVVLSAYTTAKYGVAS